MLLRTSRNDCPTLFYTLDHSRNGWYLRVKTPYFKLIVLLCPYPPSSANLQSGTYLTRGRVESHHAYDSCVSYSIDDIIPLDEILLLLAAVRVICRGFWYENLVPCPVFCTIELRGEYLIKLYLLPHERCANLCASTHRRSLLLAVSNVP